jgi:hypothetical protein
MNDLLIRPIGHLLLQRRRRNFDKSLQQIDSTPLKNASESDI